MQRCRHRLSRVQEVKLTGVAGATEGIPAFAGESVRPTIVVLLAPHASKIKSKSWVSSLDISNLMYTIITSGLRPSCLQVWVLPRLGRTWPHAERQRHRPDLAFGAFTRLRLYALFTAPTTSTAIESTAAPNLLRPRPSSAATVPGPRAARDKRIF